MIKVYHNRNFIDYSFKDDAWPVAEELTHVANVYIDDAQYGRAFELTNHIDHAWQDNDHVDAMTDKARSTSVGDVIELSDGRFMVCRSVGWAEYTEAQKYLSKLDTINNVDGKGLCPACSGELVAPGPGANKEILGRCVACGGYHVADDRLLMATHWCACGNVAPEDTRYYWHSDGHGWIHEACGQITQTG